MRNFPILFPPVVEWITIMKSKQGIPVVPGYSIGKVFVLDSEEYRIPERFIEDQEQEKELQRLHEAREKSKRELEDILDRFSQRFGGDTAPIVESYISILDDRHLLEIIENSIRENNHSAEYAVSKAFRDYIRQMKASSSDDYVSRIQDDVDDVESRWIRNLLGEQRESIEEVEERMIVIARKLTPSQTATLPRDKVLAFATDEGGRTSHTAIVARDLGIPAVVGIGDVTADVSGGDTVIVDGNRGLVIVNPNQETIDKYRELERDFQEFEERLLREMKGKPAETSDGHHISLMGNIQYPGEIDEALEYGADGIGLYRTEFLYFDSNNHHPSEEAHYNAYRESLQKMEGRPITFRTVDLGADKLRGNRQNWQNNPFLGMRGVRLCIEHSDLFRTQLRAILRAALEGEAKILFPMISSQDELKQVLTIYEECKEELRTDNIPFSDNIPLGVMVEVPSLALTIDLIADDVDFLSIGTNDLIQYAIAVDRTNAEIANLYKPSHPAILRILQEIFETGKQHDLSISLCGEMCSDIKYVLLLLGMGLEVFSVAPTAMLEVKKIIRSVSLEEAEEIAEKVMEMSDPEETETFLTEHAKRIVPEAF